MILCAFLRMGSHLRFFLLAMITLIQQFIKRIPENEYFLMRVNISRDDGLVGVPVVKQQKRRDQHLHKSYVVQCRKEGITHQGKYSQLLQIGQRSEVLNRLEVIIRQVKHLQSLVMSNIRADNLDAIIRKEEFLQACKMFDTVQFANLIELQVENAEMDERAEILDLGDHVIAKIKTSKVGEGLKGLDAMYLFWFGGAEVEGLCVCWLVSQQLLYSYHLNWIKQYKDWWDNKGIIFLAQKTQKPYCKEKNDLVEKFII